MKVVVESPKARVVYDDPQAAATALVKWLAAVKEGEPCRSITVAIHADGEACDHETGGAA